MRFRQAEIPCSRGFGPKWANLASDQAFPPAYARSMFTGLIEHTGRVEAVEPAPHGATLVIAAEKWDRTPGHGDSIAVNGCCLTVANQPAEGQGETLRLRFDVIPQTLQLTAIGDLHAGDSVNLESAATPSTLLGGHLVQGHVDGVGLARRVVGNGERDEWRIRVTPPSALLDLAIPQGSIAIDGVSLTIAAVEGDSFDITLIPTTIEKTNLGRIGVEKATRVNLEADYLVRAVQHLLQRAGRID